MAARDAIASATYVDNLDMGRRKGKRNNTFISNYSAIFIIFMVVALYIKRFTSHGIRERCK